nr:hypothetical protein [Candidatus Sigynarchaeota archaeon]
MNQTAFKQVVRIFAILAIFSICFAAPRGTGSTGHAGTDENAGDISVNQLEYYVTKYLVRVEILGNNLQFQVNITYNVTSGIKTDGFKRFLAPAGGFGVIDVTSVAVYDGNTRLTSSFRFFTGYGGQNYQEVSFTHPGFTGVRTISINFLAMNWLVETFMDNKVSLPNIRTFSVPVEDDEYQILFPSWFPSASVQASVFGTSNVSYIGGRMLYTFDPDYVSTSGDMEFAYTPKSTNGIVIILCSLAAVVMLVAWGMVKQVKKVNRDADALFKKFLGDKIPATLRLDDFDPVEIAFMRSPSGFSLRILPGLLQASIMDLYSRGIVKINRTNIYAPPGPFSGELHEFTHDVYNRIPSAPFSIESIFKEKGNSFKDTFDLILMSLARKGIMKRCKDFNKTGGAATMLIVVTSIALGIVSLGLGILDPTYARALAWGCIGAFSLALVLIRIGSKFRNYYFTPTGLSIQSIIQQGKMAEHYKDDFKAALVNTKDSSEIQDIVKSRLQFLMLSDPTLDSWRLNQWLSSVGLEGIGDMSFIEKAGALRSGLTPLDAKLLAPPPPPPGSGGGGGCSGCGGCGGGCGGCGGGGGGGCGGCGG